jgi:ribosomal protein L29
MEVKIINAEEIRGFDVGRRKELETELRRNMAELRMDIYSPANSNATKIKTLKKNLARLNTVKTEEQAKAKKA